MIACEGARPSLIAPKIPERRSARVTDNPASNGADLIRVHSGSPDAVVEIRSTAPPNPQGRRGVPRSDCLQGSASSSPHGVTVQTARVPFAATGPQDSAWLSRRRQRRMSRVGPSTYGPAFPTRPNVGRGPLQPRVGKIGANRSKMNRRETQNFGYFLDPTLALAISPSLPEFA